MIKWIRRHRVISKAGVTAWAVAFFALVHFWARLVVAEPHVTTDHLALLHEAIIETYPDRTDAWPAHLALLERMDPIVTECAEEYNVDRRLIDLREACRNDWNSDGLERYRDLLARLTPVLRKAGAIDPSSYYLLPLRELKRDGEPLGFASISYSFPVRAITPANGGDHQYAAALRYSVETYGWAPSVDLIDTGLNMAEITATTTSATFARSCARSADALLQELRRLLVEHPPTAAEAEMILAALDDHSGLLVDRDFQILVFAHKADQASEFNYGPSGVSSQIAGFPGWHRDIMDRMDSLPSVTLEFRRVSNRADFLADAPIAVEDLHAAKSLSANDLANYKTSGRRHYRDNARRHGRFMHLEILGSDFNSVLNSWFVMYELENAIRGTRIAVLLAAYEREYGRPPASLADLALDPDALVTVQGESFEYAPKWQGYVPGDGVRPTMSLKSRAMKNLEFEYPAQTREFFEPRDAGEPLTNTRGRWSSR